MSSREERSASTPPPYDQAAPGGFPVDSDDEREAAVASDLSSLSRAVRARKAEYTRQRTVRIKVGTWNVAAIAGTEKDIGAWFVEGKGMCERLSGLSVKEGQNEKSGRRESSRRSDYEGKDDAAAPGSSNPDEVGIYVLGLQEIVDVSSPSETLRPYVDPGPSNRWKDAVQKALPEGYQLIAEQQLVGLLLLVYAAPSIAGTISSVSTSSVGTGLMGYMGNKGAVTARLVLGETTRLVFINCHLAAGSDKGSLERRNWDASQIVSRTKFDPIDAEHDLVGEPSGSIGKEDFAFWFGDLNYRLEDIPGDDVRRLLLLHTQNEYDRARQPRAKFGGHGEKGPSSPHIVAQEEHKPVHQRDGSLSSDEGPIALIDNDIDPHTDPASLQTTLSSLLPHDQLRLQQKKGKAFHEGWREGEINFLPTYKYDIGSVAMFDSSEKQRGPSWCDRILYRSRHDRLNYERKVREAEEARKRDEEMKARGLDKAVEDDNVLFDYDPDVDGANDLDDYDENEDAAGDPAPDESVMIFEDPIRLDYYTSHQGILSSDHKPLDAAFTLTYEAVIPELKAKVHQEVVRELDKAENELRPGVTIVVDHQGDDPSATSNGDVAGDPNAVCFGDVRFDVPISRDLTIANTSGVPATFLFTERPCPEGEVSGVTPPWLELRVGLPSDGKKQNGQDEHTLAPGETANVELKVHIKDIDHVRSLNSGEAKVEDILVLRVLNGRDHFIPVYGKWLPSCFGRSLDDLTRMPEGGARSLGATPSAESQGKTKTVRLSAPRELFRLTDAIADLTERAVAEWSMTRDGEPPPWSSEPYGTSWPFRSETWTLEEPTERSPLLASVREALDTGSSVSDIFPPEVSSIHRLEILSETLVAFLRSLKDGIITSSVWHDMDQRLIALERAKLHPRSTEEAQAWVLEILAPLPAHSVSFTFLTFMLVRIANEVAPVTTMPARPPPAASKSPTIPATPVSSTIFSADQPLSPSSPSSFISAAGSFRRRTRTLTTSSSSDTTATSVSPAILRRQAVETALSSLFADVMISCEGLWIPSKEKERRAWEERRRSIIEPFLKTAGVDDDGPSGGAR
ncbi:hypothetical protein VTN00DRAFT_1266 [Thermoascus crustaceus]|uniref:uncharacterized protein n=1 Tax=Thermoascus crustaceus TaxID=5088 RepID=UPI003743E109